MPPAFAVAPTSVAWSVTVPPMSMEVALSFVVIEGDAFVTVVDAPVVAVFGPTGQPPFSHTGSLQPTVTVSSRM